MRATSVLLGLALAWAGAAWSAVPPPPGTFGAWNPGADHPATANPGVTNAAPAPAGPVDGLVAKGFVVVKSTQVDGDFDGCDYDRKVPLQGGGVFTCSSFGYMHAYRPRAVLLKSPDGHAYKLVIENAVFDGAFSYS